MLACYNQSESLLSYLGPVKKDLQRWFRNIHRKCTSHLQRQFQTSKVLFSKYSWNIELLRVDYISLNYLKSFNKDGIIFVSMIIYIKIIMSSKKKKKSGQKLDKNGNKLGKNIFFTWFCKNLQMEVCDMLPRNCVSSNIAVPANPIYCAALLKAKSVPNVLLK